MKILKFNHISDGKSIYDLSFESCDGGIVCLGELGGVKLLRSPVFHIVLKQLSDGTKYEYSSAEGWESAELSENRVWRDIISDVARELEEIGVDGIYFDQIAATSPGGCYNPEHSHLPGGGTHWTDGYREMMAEIRNKTCIAKRASYGGIKKLL